MAVKLLDANKGELMTITALARDGDALVVRGKVYGSMPMSAYVRPGEARRMVGLLNAKLVWFLITLPFRKT